MAELRQWYYDTATDPDTFHPQESNVDLRPNGTGSLGNASYYWKGLVVRCGANMVQITGDDDESNPRYISIGQVGS